MRIPLLSSALLLNACTYECLDVTDTRTHHVGQNFGITSYEHPDGARLIRGPYSREDHERGLDRLDSEQLTISVLVNEALNDGTDVAEEDMALWEEAAHTWNMALEDGEAHYGYPMPRFEMSTEIPPELEGFSCESMTREDLPAMLSYRLIVGCTVSNEYAAENWEVGSDEGNFLGLTTLNVCEGRIVDGIVRTLGAEESEQRFADYPLNVDVVRDIISTHELGHALGLWHASGQHSEGWPLMTGRRLTSDHASLISPTPQLDTELAGMACIAQGEDCELTPTKRQLSNWETGDAIQAKSSILLADPVIFHCDKD